MSINLNLNKTCFTVQNKEIVEGTLKDFERLVEIEPTPYGIQRKYFIERAIIENNVVWALLYWHRSEEKILLTFSNEKDALSKLEEFAALDILNNNQIFIHLNRKSAENELYNLLQDQAL